MQNGRQRIDGTAAARKRRKIIGSPENEWPVMGTMQMRKRTRVHASDAVRKMLA